jgi:hypothetical protein
MWIGLYRAQGAGRHRGREAAAQACCLQVTRLARAASGYAGTRVERIPFADLIRGVVSRLPANCLTSWLIVNVNPTASWKRSN